MLQFMLHVLADWKMVIGDENKSISLDSSTICKIIMAVISKIPRSKKLANLDKKKLRWLILKAAHASHGQNSFLRSKIKSNIDSWLNSPCSDLPLKNFRHLQKIKCNLHTSDMPQEIGSACAIVVIGEGRGKKGNTVFINSAKETIFALTQMGVKKDNIFEINDCNSSSITEIFKQVKTKNPSRLYFIYFGHGTKNKLEISQSYKPQGQDFHNLLKELQCSEYIIILDCCEAGSIEIMPDFSNSYKKPSLFALFTSSKPNESAFLGTKQTTYSKYLIPALQGAKQCPSSTENCRQCKRFRSLHFKRTFKLYHLQKYLKYHMKLNAKTHMRLNAETQTPQLGISRGSADQFFFPSDRLGIRSIAK